MLKDQSRMFYTGRDRELIVGQYMQYGNGVEGLSTVIQLDVLLLYLADHNFYSNAS